MTRFRVGWKLVLRSLFIQGSWNYRGLIGSGVAWALLPFLQRNGSSGERDSVARIGRTFNAHPYLAPLALGALVRLEEDGADPDRVTHFREALRAPLGSLGDGLVWLGWRPFCLLLAILCAILGASPVASAIGFLLVYNVVHIALRAWGANVGLARGFQVGEALRSLRLPWWTERIATGGVIVLGLTGGALAGRGMEALPNAFGWFAAAAVFLFSGAFGGAVLGRWTSAFLLLLVIAGVVIGSAIPFAG